MHSQASTQTATQIKQTVGRNIQRARAEANLSQFAAGLKLGLDPRAFSRWETGRVLPGPAKLAKLAQEFGKDIAWFYSENGDA